MTRRSIEQRLSGDAGALLCLILAPDLAERLILVRQRLSGDDIELLRRLMAPLAHRCWQGELSAIDPRTGSERCDADATLPEDARRRFLQLFD